MRNLFLFSIIFQLCGTAFAQNSKQREIDNFTSQTGAIATTDKATNSLNYLRFPIGKALNLEGNSPQQKALFFTTKYANLFEKRTDNHSYLVKNNKRDNYGLDHVVLQQYYDQVPIYDGVLKFHFNKTGGLTSVNGNFIIVEEVNTIPTISRQEAEQLAINLVSGQKDGKLEAPLKIKKNTLFVFQKGLAQGYMGTLHLVYELEVRNEADVREFLYIDAHTKELVEQFTGTHGVNRKLYEPSGSALNLKWVESDGIAGPKFGSLTQWQKSEIESAGHTYNLMKNAFGRSSYDNADATMVTIDNHPYIGCPNASWNGETANFCTGVASDDIVAHEWAHAYTEYTSGLIYAWQAGALNEAYSDIWGETIDQLNGYFDSAESNALRNGCASSARWLVGEQASAFGGAIRDMWDPTCLGDPGKVSDQKYWCSSNDNGGVHTNSGIINHTYALLVDGGDFNGQTITGLGLTKAAHIFWQTQANHLTSTTDFAAQADILEASLMELIDIDLPALSTSASSSGLSGIKITSSDLEQLIKVIAAVEMRMENNCNFVSLFKPVSSLCYGASLSNNNFFVEDFENGTGSWKMSNAGNSPTWIPRDWVLDMTPPDGHTGQVMFAKNLDTGNCGTSRQNGMMSLISPEIKVPATFSSWLTLSFEHYVSLENGQDGGNLSYKIDNDPWLPVPKTAFTDNGYNAVLLPAIGPSFKNPMEGQAAFSGGDQGSLASGWGESRINLNALKSNPSYKFGGKTIQFRWDLGTDGCNGWDGWYIDNVRVYTCSAPAVQFVTTNSLVAEGDAKTVNAAPNECLPYLEETITVKIKGIPSKPVTVTFNLSGSASQGTNADYSIIPSSFVLQANELSKDVIVRVYDDGNSEDDEDVTLTYTLSSPAGGDAAHETFNQEYTLHILDNDKVLEVNDKVAIHSKFDPDPFWTIVGGGQYPQTWGVVTLFNSSLDPANPPLLFIRSDYGQGVMDKIVESPAFNSIGMTSINLTFLEYFLVRDQPNDFNEQAIVDVWDGTAWQNLLIQSEATGTSGSYTLPKLRNIPIPLEFANAAMKIRFRYIADNDYWWALDNVKIVTTHETQIHSAVSLTPGSQYLGPNATVYFRDPTSGDLIAKIKNLTAHDYGCTSVSVDRAGQDETTWFGAHKITNKTFKVTPTNDNLNGKYEITLYYKASELPDFNGPDIKSLGKSGPGIQQATSANSVSAAAQLSMFNSDYAYTATFNSGFGGFGVSNAPSGDALPVTLSCFNGKHSTEGNVLLWETVSEFNNDYFAVERSVDAKTFSEIARIPGIGTSNTANKHTFTDYALENKVNYYRLKQVDQDGTFAYSHMIAIDSPSINNLKVFPNPVQSWLSIELPTKDTELCNVNVMNASGRVVLSSHQVRAKQGKLSLDLSKLTAGIYHIIVATKTGEQVFKIAKLP